MRAVVITRPGGPDVLAMRDVPTPVPAPRELLVRVHATALNRADLLQRRGRYQAPPGAVADVPGLEYAGVVEAIGDDVRDWTAGARVMGLIGGGGYAEYVTVPADHALPVPERLSLEQAAAVPEAYLTAHDALFTQAGARPGERLLVHAIASGVGVALLQLGLAFDLDVIGTSRSAWKLERMRELGLANAVLADDDVLAAVRDVVGGGRAGGAGGVDGAGGAQGDDGVDVVVDLVGGDYLSANIALLRPRGRLVIVGLVAGRTAQLDMGAVLGKRLHVIGTAMRSRSDEEKAEVTRFFRTHAWPLLDDGRLDPVIDDIVAMDHAAEAHARMESNANVGKIVLRW